MLQVNLHRHNPTDLTEQTRSSDTMDRTDDRSNDFFTVMEVSELFLGSSSGSPGQAGTGLSSPDRAAEIPPSTV